MFVLSALEDTGFEVPLLSSLIESGEEVTPTVEWPVIVAKLREVGADALTVLHIRRLVMHPRPSGNAQPHSWGFLFALLASV